MTTNRKQKAFDLLELPISSPKSAIRQKYRKLARKHHPDRGGDPKDFLKLQKAKSILIDSDPDNCTSSDDENNANEITIKSKDFHHPLSVTLDDLYIGRVSNIPISRNVFNSKDDKDDGKQTTTKKVRDVLKVTIQPGTHHRDTIIFKGMSDQVPGKSITGDVILRIKQLPHDYFVRNGDNLLYGWNINLIEALVGNDDIKEKEKEKSASTYYHDMEHLDARTIRLNISRPARNFLEGFCVKGEGMPCSGYCDGNNSERQQYGDLFLVRKVLFPNQLSMEQIHLLKLVLGSSGIDNENEKRWDDGSMYTKQEFLDFYHGLNEWNVAKLFIKPTTTTATTKVEVDEMNVERELITCKSCSLSDFEQFHYSFPVLAKGSCWTKEKVVEVVVENKMMVNSDVLKKEPTKCPSKNRRWSVDDDYGVDDSMLEEEDRCDTQ